MTKAATPNQPPDYKIISYKSLHYTQKHKRDSKLNNIHGTEVTLGLQNSMTNVQLNGPTKCTNYKVSQNYLL